MFQDVYFTPIGHKLKLLKQKQFKISQMKTVII